MSKRIAVYLSEEEIKEVLACFDFKLNQDFDVSIKLIEKFEEELATFIED